VAVMLIYHPAYDLNHCVFRMLRLLEVNGDHQLKWDMFRILDFYYLFPHQIGDAQLPKKFIKRKRDLGKTGSKYTHVPGPRVFIQQMQGIHESVARSLIGKGFLDAQAFASGVLRRTAKPVPGELSVAFAAATDDASLIEMLATELTEIPLSGPSGLKERTGLLEHRYDTP
jgi:hypothetical protein